MAKKAAAKKRAPLRKGVPPGRGGQRVAGRAKGQAPFRPTDAQRETVRRLRATGFDVPHVALHLRVPLRTVERHFAEELKNGRSDVHMRVALDHMEQVLGTDVHGKPVTRDKTHQIYFTKHAMGWRDGYRVGFEDKEGTPVNPSNFFSINIEGLGAA